MNKWDSAYRQWLDDCLDEWNEKFPSETKILGHDGPNCIEFGESGDAYPHGIGGTEHMRAAVTSWEDSMYYQP